MISLESLASLVKHLSVVSHASCIVKRGNGGLRRFAQTLENDSHFSIGRVTTVMIVQPATSSSYPLTQTIVKTLPGGGATTVIVVQSVNRFTVPTEAVKTDAEQATRWGRHYGVS